jgi:hypothetical protein
MSERTGDGFLSRVGGVFAALVFLGVGVYLLVYGAQVWSVEHSGIPAQVKILKGCSSPVGSRMATCPAAWKQADGTERRVTVDGDDRELSYGKTVDVRIRGDQAYTTNGWSSYSLIAGIALSGFGVWILLPSRRRERDRRPQTSQSDDPGAPHAQIT